MFKKLWGLHNVYIYLLCFCGAQTAVFYFLNRSIFYISLCLFTVLLIFAISKLLMMGQKINKLIKSINEDLDSTTSNALSVFSLPVLIVSSNDEIIWYNSKFSKEINTEVETLVGKGLEEFLGSHAAEELKLNQKATFTFDNNILDAYQTTYNIAGEDQKIICFVNCTELRKIASEYKLSRPIVAFVAIDNIDDITRSFRDSERNLVISKIQTVLEEWFASVNGISRRLSGEKYLFIFEERGLISFISSKFDILNQIRNINLGDNGNATISVGIGSGNNFKECEDNAAQALDMALGRGGDQVAIKNSDNSFRFFGGVSGGSNSSSRVRARMAASNLLNIIKNSKNVIIMGHKFADLDCYGASFALCSAIRKVTPLSSVIALDSKTALVSSLTDRIKALGLNTMIAHPESVLETANKDSVLIIVDTHRKSLLECPELLDRVGTVIIIDHHRKAVDFISDCSFFYHDPAASSASEMVCELLQYVSAETIGKGEAEALLSGIFLDTKNYCINTGVRTFEASAFLRKKGADLVAVRNMFADSIDAYKIKTSVISTAQQFEEYVIAVNDTDLCFEEKKIISSSAADELLNLKGVNCSFVITPFDNMINISARSLGEVNVQIIMEKLGGGGHRNMAACQLENTNIDGAKKLLLDTIISLKKG